MIQIFGFFSVARTTWYRLFMTDYVGILVSNRFWFPHTNTHARQIAVEKTTKKQHTNYTQSHIALFSTILLLCFFSFHFVSLYNSIWFIHFWLYYNSILFFSATLQLVGFRFSIVPECVHQFCFYIQLNICFSFFGLKNIDWFVYVTTLLYADTFVDDLKKKTNRLRMTINLCHDWRFDQKMKKTWKFTYEIDWMNRTHIRA